MSKKKALGRGLSALLSDSPSDDRLEVDSIPNTTSAGPAHTPTVSPSGMTEIPIEEIEVNPFQPRTHFERRRWCWRTSNAGAAGSLLHERGTWLY